MKVFDVMSSSEASSVKASTTITSWSIVRRKESSWLVGCGPIIITVALSVAMAVVAWFIVASASARTASRAIVFLLDTTVPPRA